MRRIFLLFTWIITDILLFLGAYAAAYFLRVGFVLSTDFPLNLYMQSACMISPIWILLLIQLGVFKLTRVQASIKNLSYLLFASIFASALFTLTYYFLYANFFSRLLLVYAGSFSFIFSTIWHISFDQWQRKVLRKNPPTYPVLIIGTNREAERIIALLEERQAVLKPIGILDAQGSSLKQLRNIPVLGKLNVLEKMIKEKKPTHLIQCSNLEHTINIQSACKQLGVTYLLSPSVVGRGDEIETIEGQPFITTKK